MPETLALVRVALTRSRLLLVVMGAAIIVGQLSFLVSISVAAEQDDTGFAMFALFYSLLPAAIASIVLFDYGFDSEMNRAGSGCSHWLLRMPIHSWKIALVPVILKTMWISLLWCLFLWSAGRLGMKEEVPLFAPCLAFSSAAIWILVIAWRPFQSDWYRVAALVVMIPIIIGGIAFVFVAPSLTQVEWRPIAKSGSLISAIVIYGVGVWTVVRAVKLARTSSAGIIPEVPGRFFGQVSASEELPVARFRSPCQALFRYDFIKATSWIRKLVLGIAIPVAIGFVLFVNLSVPAVVAVLVLFAWFAGIGLLRDASIDDIQKRLPVYLATSPLATKSIAWTRFQSPLFLAAGVFSLTLFVFAGWACWSVNREIWMSWATRQATALDSTATTTIGIRWSIAIVLGWGVIFLSRMAAYQWIDMTGRTWVAIVMMVVGVLYFFIPLVVGLRWFMEQTDWESTRTSAIGFLSWVPTVVAILLIVKAAGTIGSTILLLQRQLASTGDLIRVTAIWAATVVVLSIGFAILIPDPRVTLWWSLAVVTIVIPLGRVLLLPVALDWDRHR